MRLVNLIFKAFEEALYTLILEEDA